MASENPKTEQNLNPASAAGALKASGKSEPTVTAINPWDGIKVGARVLAAYWNDENEFTGFWLANVTRIDRGEFTLEWFNEPEHPPFSATAKNIALVHPEFRPSGK